MCDSTLEAYHRAAIAAARTPPAMSRAGMVLATNIPRRVPKPSPWPKRIGEYVRVTTTKGKKKKQSQTKKPKPKKAMRKQKLPPAMFLP